MIAKTEKTALLPKEMQKIFRNEINIFHKIIARRIKIVYYIL